MKKLLITCATRSFSIRVTQLLAKHFDLVLATADEVPSVWQGRYHKIPRGVNPTYAHELLKLALDLQCAYVLPMGMDELATLAESKILFEEYGIDVLGPNKTELTDVSVVENPAKELPLSLFVAGFDVLGASTNASSYSGLGILSDSGESFLIAVAK